MKCSKCGAEIEAGSAFCTQCGQLVQQEPKKMAVQPRGIKPVYCAGIILAALIIIGIIVGSYTAAIHKLENENSALSTEISQKNASLEGLRKENAKQLDELKQKESELSAAQVEAKKFDDLCEMIKNNPLGTSSQNYNISDYVICLAPGQTKQLTLTTTISSVTVSCSSANKSVGYIDFNQSSWYGNTTTLTAHGLSEGTTLVTFTNNRNGDFFNVLMIVKK